MTSALKHRLGLSQWLNAAHATCDVCGGQLRPHAYYLEEEVDVPDPRQSWTLCPVCIEAIERRLTQAPLQAPHRMRVAVGLVASERADPHTMSERVSAAEGDRLAERHFERWLVMFFLLCFIVHALVFVLIVLEIALR